MNIPIVYNHFKTIQLTTIQNINKIRDLEITTLLLTLQRYKQVSHYKNGYIFHFFYSFVFPTVWYKALVPKLSSSRTA